MWHHNVDLLAYHDLDGRSGFKLALQEVAGRFFLYVAGFWHSGWSILDVTDPEHPELLRFLEGPPNTMTIQVQVADGTMITASPAGGRRRYRCCSPTAGPARSASTWTSCRCSPTPARTAAIRMTRSRWWRRRCPGSASPAQFRRGG
jgi:hypothetical protein